MIKQAKSPRLALKKMMTMTWGWALLAVRNLPEHSCNCTASQITYFTLLFSHLADGFIQSDLQIRKRNYNYKLKLYKY